MKTVHENKIAEHIGSAVDGALGKGPGMEEPDRVIQNLNAMMIYASRQPSPQRWQPALVIAIAAALLFGIGIFFYFQSKTVPSLDFRINKSDLPVSLGEILKTEENNQIQVVFNNGSIFEMGGDSTATVARADTSQVNFNLLRGTVSARIQGNGNTKWTVNAGNYRVTAIGTAFIVTMERDNALHVSVTQGKVLVEGGDIDVKGISLSSGYCLSIDDKEMFIKSCSPQATGGPMSPPLEESPVDTMSMEANPEVDSSHLEQTTAKLPVPPRESGPNGSTWRALVEKGNYGEIISLLETKDIQWIERNGDANLLWQLARAARYQKKTAIAITFLVALRKRFPATRRSKTAAFLVAKTHMELLSDQKNAIKWFNIYIAESPGGALVEEAVGHLMTLHKNRGNIDEARKYARRYLKDYDGGAFSKYARTIVHQ